MMPDPDHQNPVLQAVASLFHAVETGQWATVRSLLADPVDVAHGPNRQTLPREQLARDWENSHTAFVATRYQLEPVGVETATDRATARFQSQIRLIPSGADAEPLVIDGHHTVELALAQDGWKIRSIRHDQPSYSAPAIGIHRPIACRHPDT